MDLILRAARFAETAHRGQPRKYHGAPYIEHPGRVAARISRHRLATPSLVAAAWLHDVLEDCPVTPEELITEFGMEVRELVGWLTNPSKAHPDLPRAQRKAIDRDHIAASRSGARLIKLADRADNLRDMRDAPTSFLRVYVPESEALLEVLAGTTDTELEQELREALSPLRGLLATFDRPAVL